MCNVRYNWNPNEKCTPPKRPPGSRTKHTIHGAIVRPENPQKKTYNSTRDPASRTKHTIHGAIVRPENTRKNIQFNRIFLLLALLLRCRQTMQRPPAGATTENKLLCILRSFSTDTVMNDGEQIVKLTWFQHADLFKWINVSNEAAINCWPPSTHLQFCSRQACCCWAARIYTFCPNLLHYTLRLIHSLYVLIIS